MARTFGKVILYLVLRPPITFVIRHSPLVISFLLRHYIPLLEGSQRQLGMCPARAEYVRRGRFVSFSSLSPFGGSGAYRINDLPHSPFFVIRHSSFSPFFVMLPPIAYGLRPSAYSSFFRLETPFLAFLALLYYIMSQLFTHPFYTNRPSFVHHSYILSIS